MPHDQFKSCIAACNTCAETCDHCAAACLREKEVQAMARCIALDIDCAALCRLAAGYMSRASECARTICAVCADVCDACAQECAKHSKMEHCRRCADACQRCAEECRRMATVASGAGKAGRAASLPAH